jgi:hypothetical protein
MIRSKIVGSDIRELSDGGPINVTRGPPRDPRASGRRLLVGLRIVSGSVDPDRLVG